MKEGGSADGEEDGEPPVDEMAEFDEQAGNNEPKES